MCEAFEACRCGVSEKLRAADLKSKVYHDRTTPLLTPDFVEGDLVYRRQRRIGKLLPKVEGPYTFIAYTNATRSSAEVWDDHM